ncbi:MAG: hypothetical protein WB713_02135 [Methyloceanibacter sp.]
MAASKRVSRGFHRLGLFLAAIIVLVGGYYWVVSAGEVANQDWRHHKALVCAHHFRHRDEKRFWDLGLTELDETGEAIIDLRALGCSQTVNDPHEIIKFGEVRVVPSFSWLSSFGSELLFPPILISALAALVLAVAAYGIVRAIGWVVGGFVS